MTNPISEKFQKHHKEVFEKYGATPEGVDWSDPIEMTMRYKRLLACSDNDLEEVESPTLLDVGCGWGGLREYMNSLSKYKTYDYSGIDIVTEMINHAQSKNNKDSFISGDYMQLDLRNTYDYIICNAIMTQKLELSIPEMKTYCRSLIKKMFRECKRGIAFTVMSDRVNFKAGNLFYQNPPELLSYMLEEITCRVIVDHGYSSLDTKNGRFYDYIICAYK